MTFFVQSAAILFRRAPSLSDLARLIRKHEIVKQRPLSDALFAGGNDALHVPYRPEINGWVRIDVIDQPWPDGMGSPDAESELFTAWSMGWFGPYAFPGTLARAVDSPVGFEAPERAVERHRAIVRINLSYTFNASDDDPILPDGRNPLAEVVFLTGIARMLLGSKDALCYFNPNGETLHTLESIDRSIASASSQGVVPQDVWVNSRLFDVPEGEGWMLLDTIGAEQLDRDDHEACFDPSAFNPSEAIHFLRNSLGYVLANGPVIEDGHTLSGPRESRWQSLWFKESVSPRPRPVRRFRPLSGERTPAFFGFGQLDAPKRSFFDRFRRRT